MEPSGHRQNLFLSGRTDRAQQLAHVSLADGADNTLVGLNAGARAVGRRNTYVGANVATNLGGLASNNVFLGASAGETATGVSDSVFVGHLAGQRASTGAFNVVVGSGAGRDMLQTSQNTLVGHLAGGQMVSGARNVILGAFAGYYTASAVDNVFAGARSGMNNRYGSQNVFLGSGTGRNNLRGNTNVFLGADTGAFNTDGSRNVFLGSRAGERNTIGSNNVFLGVDCGSNNLVGNNLVFLGPQAGSNNTYGDNDIFIGSGAGALNSNGSDNVFIGPMAGARNQDGSGLVYLGSGAGAASVSASNSVAVGARAAANVVAGQDNVWMGHAAGSDAAFASGVVALGARAGAAANGASNSVFVGGQAGFAATGADNTLVGFGTDAPAGNTNTYVGARAGRFSAMDRSVVVGAGTAGLMTGNDNVVVGTGILADAQALRRAVVIGAGVSNISGSDAVVVGTDVVNRSAVSNVVAVGQGISAADIVLQNAVVLGMNFPLASTDSDSFVVGLAGHRVLFANASELHIGNTELDPIVAMNDASITMGKQGVRFFEAEGEGEDHAGNGTTYVGFQAGRNITTAKFGTTLVGRGAGANSIDPLLDTGVGYQALNTSNGSENTGLGAYAGSSSIGRLNLFSGYGTGVQSEGDYNAIVGHKSFYRSLGSRNTCVGTNAGALLVGNNNVVVGAFHDRVDADVKFIGSDNVLVGNVFDVSTANIVATNTVAVGQITAPAGTILSDSLFLGQVAVSDADSGALVVGLAGTRVLFANSDSTHLGLGAGLAATGSFNSIIGVDAGSAMSGDRNTVSGSGAGAASVGTNNVILGANAADMFMGSNCVVVGASTMTSSQGNKNVVVGAGAAAALLGNNNTIVGTDIISNLQGSNNVIIGTQILQASIPIRNSIIVGSNISTGGGLSMLSNAVVIGRDITIGADFNEALILTAPGLGDCVKANRTGLVIGGYTQGSSVARVSAPSDFHSPKITFGYRPVGAFVAIPPEPGSQEFWQAPLTYADFTLGASATATTTETSNAVVPPDARPTAKISFDQTLMLRSGTRSAQGLGPFENRDGNLALVSIAAGGLTATFIVSALQGLLGPRANIGGVRIGNSAALSGYASTTDIETTKSMTYSGGVFPSSTPFDITGGISLPSAGVYYGNAAGLTNIPVGSLGFVSAQSLKLASWEGSSDFDRIVSVDATGNLRVTNGASLQQGGALTVASVNAGSGTITTTGAISGITLTSTQATGTAPLTVASTTQVTNLNAELLGGNNAAFYVNLSSNASNLTTGTLGQPVDTTGTISGLTLASTQVTGTAPLTVASTTEVTNLNAELLGGNNAAYYVNLSSNASNLTTGTLGQPVTTTGNVVAGDGVFSGNVVVSKQVSVAGNVAMTNGQMVLWDTTSGIDPGPLVQKRYNSPHDRYGIAQTAGSYMRMYASDNGFGTLALSLSTGAATYADLLTASKVQVSLNRNSAITGNLIVSANVAAVDGNFSGNAAVTKGLSVTGTGTFGGLVTASGGVTVGTSKLLSWGTATVRNNMLMLYGTGNETATDVYGLGMGNFSMRYNVGHTAASHVWYVNGAEIMRSNLQQTTITANLAVSNLALTGNVSGNLNVTASLAAAAVKVASWTGASVDKIVTVSATGNAQVVGTGSLTTTGALTVASVDAGSGTITTTGAISGLTLASTQITGTAPLTVASTTQVTNLNAELLGGNNAAYYTGLSSNATNLTTGTLSRPVSTTGTVTTTRLNVDTQYYMYLFGNNAIMNFNDFNWLQFTRASNVFSFVTSSITRAQISGSGITIPSGHSLNGAGTVNVTGAISGLTLASTQATGTAPLTVASTTLVTNLNAELLGGNNAAYYTGLSSNASNLTIGTLSRPVTTTGAISGLTLASTQATGTAPLTVASTTQVTNLNAELLGGNNAAYYVGLSSNASNLTTGTLSRPVSTTGNVVAGDGVFSGNVVVTQKISVAGNVAMTNGQMVLWDSGSNPGPLVEKRYDTLADRYGMGQFAGQTMRMYAPAAAGAGKVTLAVATSATAYTDILVANLAGISVVVGNVTMTKGRALLWDLTSGVNPGPMVEKRYDAGVNRYGLGQFASFVSRVYTAAAGDVCLSVCSGASTYTDILTANATGVVVSASLAAAAVKVASWTGASVDKIVTVSATGNAQVVTTGSLTTGGALTVASVDAGSGTIQTTGNMTAKNLTQTATVNGNLDDSTKPPGLYNYAGTVGTAPIVSTNYRTIELGGPFVFNQLAFPDADRMFFRRRGALFNPWMEVAMLSSPGGTLSLPGNLTAVAGTFSGALTVASVDAGSGAITTTGTVTGSKLACDADFYMGSPSLFTDPIINFAGFDFIKFIRSTNIFEFVIGNFRKASIDSNGNLGITGALTAVAGTFSGLVTTNAGISVPSGQTLSGAGAINVTGSLTGNNMTDGVTVGNLDVFKPPGLYMYDSGIEGTLPVAGVPNLRTIEIGPGNRRTQLAFPWNSDRMFLRRSTGALPGTFQPWVEVAVLSATGNLIVAGNVNAVDGNFTGSVTVTRNITGAEGRFTGNVTAGSANLSTANIGGVLRAGASTFSGLVTTNAGISIPTGQTLSGLGAINIGGGATVGALNAAAGTFAGVLTASGGIDGDGFLLAGGTTTVGNFAVYNAGVVASIDSGGNLTAVAGTFSGLVTTNAGISIPTGQQLSGAGAVNISGNVTAAEGRFTGNVTAGSANLSTANIGGVLRAGASTFSGLVTTNLGISIPTGQTLSGAGAVNLTGASTFGNVAVGNLALTGNVSGNLNVTASLAAAAVKVASWTSLNSDKIVTVSATGNAQVVTTGSLTTGGALTVASVDAGSGTIQTTGTVQGTKLAVDTQFYVNLSGSNPLVNFDANDYLAYFRATNTFSFYSNGTRATIDGSGNFIATGNVTGAEGRFTGNVTALSANLSTANIGGLASVGTLNVASGAVTGGATGLTFGLADFITFPANNDKWAEYFVGNSDRYGLGQGTSAMRMYASSFQAGATVNMSFATGAGLYEDVISATRRSVTVNGNLAVTGNLSTPFVNSGAAGNVAISSSVTMVNSKVLGWLGTTFNYPNMICLYAGNQNDVLNPSANLAVYGFGLGTNRLRYNVPSGAQHAFNVANVEYALISSTGLRVTGSINATGDVIAFSDARVKGNIENANLDMCAAVVENLPLKRFEWKTPVAHLKTDKKCLGWIAQDVKRVFPKAVNESEEYGFPDFHTLNQDQLIKCMYGALQQALQRIGKLETRVAQLQKSQQV